ncbi:hypothetical protein BCR35DRAFT_332649 [Leucosporidium creatinivorum]|uniref:Uncharacterized protein n=1 Tax=Leucosporidium creatinivorum TaxID=106004 RepID=A0A1Y2F050_9BASI|nr:hypothetical protein BCR35DRAFT_332649 [Leucosporidium creatinivorum]
MPISVDEYAAQFAHRTPAEAFGRPSRPLTKEKILELLEFSTAVAHCWISKEEGVEPLFPGASEEVKMLAQQVLDRDNHMRAIIAELPARVRSPFGGREREDLRFLGTFYGTWEDRHNTRPFVMLMFHWEAAVEAYDYISEINRKALHSAVNENQLDARLFVGWQHFHDPNINAWERGKTLLAAHKYEVRIHEAAARRGILLHSLAHVPSLTSRQSARTGVSQAALRQRWA